MESPYIFQMVESKSLHFYGNVNLFKALEPNS